MEIVVQVSILVVGGYLIGSIPGAYLFARWLGRKNLLAVGTGNATATAAFIHVGKLAGALGLIGEVLKGLGCLYLAHILVGEPWAYLLTLYSGIIGANWSVWLKGGGGRGQTMLVVGLAALAPLALPILAVCFGSALAITRRLYLSTHVFNLSLPLALGLATMSWMFAATGAALTIAFLIKQRRENDDLVHLKKVGSLSR